MFIYCHSLLEEPLQARLADALKASHEIFFRKEDTAESEAKSNFAKADFILGNPPKNWFEEGPENLVFWQLDSAGFDQYSSVTLKDNVRVANMGNWFARPCAETIVGGVLALYRGLDKLTLLKQQSEWVGSKMRVDLKILFRQKVIVLGAGTIAQATHAILNGLGCQVQLMARTSPDATIRSKEELMAALTSTDLVINTLPGTAHHFADKAFFENMKQGSVYASVGRGNTTDEPALIAALQSGRLAGAVLDVTFKEPLEADSPLWNMENVILTQHTGGGHKDENVGKADLFLNNIFALENGSNIVDEVDVRKGY